MIAPRLRLRLALVAVAALALGCSDDDGPNAPRFPGFESVVTIYQDPRVRTEAVTYRSDGLLVKGLVSRPQLPGRFPVYVLNHGGFDGVAEGDTSRRTAARNGFVVLEASYRGEDGSQGTVEVSLGEVDDVLRLIEIGLAQTYADPTRVIMVGGSHGGAITLRALQKGAPVHAAIAFFPPTDFAAAYRSWRDGLASSPSPADSADYATLMQILETATGGTPESHPAEYAARSAALDPAGLPPIPLMVLQGTTDILVPHPQACTLAVAAGGFASWYTDLAGNTLPGAPSGCPGVTWQAGPRPSPTWPGDRYLVVYDGVGHEFTATMVQDAFDFLFAHAPTGRRRLVAPMVGSPTMRTRAR